MNNLNIAYAALLHDIGKFYQRTTKISLLNSQEIASTPKHANGYHTHIHSGYTVTEKNIEENEVVLFDAL